LSEARDRSTSAPEVAFLAALALAPWPYGCAEDVARYALSAVLLLAAAGWALARHRAGAGLPAPAAAAFALPALALAQLALGRSAAPVATAEAALVGASAAGAFAFWSDRARERHAARRLALVVLGTCGAQAVFGAAQWSLAPGTLYGRAVPVITAPFGSYVNHNHFAGLVEMGAVLALALAVGAWRRGGGPTPQAVGFAGVGLGLVGAHVASRSRGGLLALAAGLALLAVLATSGRRERGARRPWRAVALLAALALAFGLAVAPSATRAHLLTLLSGPTDPSGQYRLDTLGATLRAALARPLLGWGLGAYADAAAAYKRGHGEVRTTHAESDALELLAEAGVLGLGLGLLLLGLATRALLRRLAAGRDPLRKAVAFGAGAACGALLVHSLVDFNLRVPANALVFASLLGLAAAPREEERRVKGAAAASVVLALMAGLAAWRAAGAWELARALGERGPRRLAALDGVLARHPYLPEAWRARGNAVWVSASGSGPLAAVRLARAESDLGRALALRPCWGEAWADLASARFRRGDRAGAKAALAQALALDPTHTGIARAAGWISP
jgi:O-antigen ligase